VYKQERLRAKTVKFKGCRRIPDWWGCNTDSMPSSGGFRGWPSRLQPLFGRRTNAVTHGHVS